MNRAVNAIEHVPADASLHDAIARGGCVLLGERSRFVPHQYHRETARLTQVRVCLSVCAMLMLLNDT